MPIGPKGQKRPRDLNQLAKLIVAIATGQVSDRESGQRKQASKSSRDKRNQTGKASCSSSSKPST
jgi:hypothetical protein